MTDPKKPDTRKQADNAAIAPPASGASGLPQKGYSTAHHVAEVLHRGGHHAAARRYLDLLPLRTKINNDAQQTATVRAIPSDGGAA